MGTRGPQPQPGPSGEKAGHEFFQGRLARAQAQRSPEVAAFIAAMQQYDDWAHLLPLTSDGKAAVAPGPERERRLQLAILLAAHANYLCPEPVPVLRQLGDQLLEYLPDHQFRDRWIDECATASKTSDPGAALLAVDRYLGTYSGSNPLQHVLRLYAVGSTNHAAAQSDHLPSEHIESARMTSVSMYSTALELLRDPQHQQAIDLGLAALQAGPELPPGRQLLTAGQLAHICGCQVALGAGLMLVRFETCLTPATVKVAGVKHVLRKAATASEIVVQLEPDNPRSYLEAARYYQAAARMTPWQAREAPPQPLQRIVDLCLKAVSLGQQQGSDWWVACCAPPALLVCEPGVSRASMSAAVAAVQQAGPALKRCKPLLPDSWVKAAECLLVQTPSLVASVQAHLGLAQGPPGSGANSSSHGLGGMVDMEEYACAA